ncbi:MAG: hypothetical protein HQL26_00350 [Candidatus Omnitrophica bacterium]|nr:hypothetical protein [Candidatus Omnitrophota bacterium]
MKNESKKVSCKSGSCSDSIAKKVWLVVGAVVVLAVLFCAAMFKTKNFLPPGAVASTRSAQQAAYVPFCGVRGGQQAAFQQNNGIIHCPRCNFDYNDSTAVNRGFSRCPRCQGYISCRNQNGGGFRNVALTQPVSAPPIFRDALMPHEFRGVCENCHVVNPDITIPISSTQMPHEYRGVCSNCHTILGG